MPKDAMHWRHLCEFNPSSLSSTTRQVRRDQRETLGKTSRCFCVGTNVATGIMTQFLLTTHSKGHLKSKAGLAMILKNTCMRYPHLDVLPIYIQASARIVTIVDRLGSPKWLGFVTLHYDFHRNLAIVNLAVVGALSSNLALFLSYTHETCGRCYHEVQVVLYGDLFSFPVPPIVNWEKVCMSAAQYNFEWDSSSQGYKTLPNLGSILHMCWVTHY
ncbi:hypothetical protein EDB85DRAFT_1903121 [Lactarius pseudohatsudake]|nr:hypothetical protein EDB85DRAFT_1903121 [Lactarius pseudohatsudake]